MIIDKNDLNVLDRHEWSSLADVGSGVVRRYLDEDTGLEILLHKNPACSNEDSMVFVSHALSALKSGELVFRVQMEALDLRSMSSALGVALKSLMSEYGTRSYLTPMRTLIYGNGEREDLGVYLGQKEDEDIFSFMENLFSDSFIVENEEDWSEWLYDPEEDEE